MHKIGSKAIARTAGSPKNPKTKKRISGYKNLPKQGY